MIKLITIKKGDLLALLKDISLFIDHNKALIVFVVFIIFIGNPLVAEWRRYRNVWDQNIIYQDQRLGIIEGEDVTWTNALITKRRREGTFNGKFLSVYTLQKPDEGHISLKYQISVKKTGIYRIYIAGSPPGALTRSMNTGSGIYFSPYEVILDRQLPVELSEEKRSRESGRPRFFWYYQYAVDMDISKVGEFIMAEGLHELEFKIKRSRLYDDHYVIYLDAIFIVPADWKPEKELFSYPSDMFLF